MSSEHDPSEDDQPPACAEQGCETRAVFWMCDGESGGWRPVCERHARHAHPSLELRAWFESGYLKPVELGRPDAPPADPRDARTAAFREEVDELMGWSDRDGAAE